jgi:hypothetical protein
MHFLFSLLRIKDLYMFRAIRSDGKVLLAPYVPKGITGDDDDDDDDDDDVFRALLAHPQEALNKRHSVHCVRVMSVGCTRVGVEQSNPSAAN